MDSTEVMDGGKKHNRVKTKIVSASSSERGSQTGSLRENDSVTDDDVSITSSQILDLSELNLVLSQYMSNSKNENITEVLTSIDKTLKSMLKNMSRASK
jgi:hypothetical protein